MTCRYSFGGRLAPGRRRRGRPGQVVVDSFDEHVAGVGRNRIEAVVLQRHLRRLDLVQRSTRRPGVADTVADDRRHVAELDHVGLVGDAAVAGNDPGASLLVEFGHGEIDQVIQAVEDALHRPAPRRVELRV
jgi:hypothetical protein